MEPEEKNKKFNNIVSRVLLTAAGVVAELFAVSLIVAKPLTVTFILLGLLLVSTIYTLDFYKEYKSQISVNQRRWLSLVLFVIFILFLILVYSFHDFWLSIVSLALLILGTLYDPYFKRLTKIVIGFKDYFVIICFNLFLLIYLIWSHTNLNGVLFILLFALTRDFVNVSYCDIKDISPDKQKGLLTLVNVLGINKLIKIQGLVSLLSVIILILAVYLGYLPQLVYGLIIPVVITYVLILASHKRKSYSASNVDYEYYFWLIFIFIAKLVIR